MVRGTFSPAQARRPAVVARLARTLGHAGKTFSYPKCSIFRFCRLGTSLGYFREARGSCHLCGGRPLQLFRIASFSVICSALKQPAAKFIAHGVLLPPSSHLPPTVQAWPNHSLKLSDNGVPRWPSGAGASPHFAPAVQRAPPLSPA